MQLKKSGRKADVLTAKQEAYCIARAMGKDRMEAYKAYCPNTKASKGTMYANTSRLEKLEKIQNRIAELQAIAVADAIPSIQQIQADLVTIATDESRPDAIRLKAYDQLTRMKGGYNDTISVENKLTLKERKGALSDLIEKVSTEDAVALAPADGDTGTADTAAPTPAE